MKGRSGHEVARHKLREAHAYLDLGYRMDLTDLLLRLDDEGATERKRQNLVPTAHGPFKSHGTSSVRTMHHPQPMRPRDHTAGAQPSFKSRTTSKTTQTTTRTILSLGDTIALNAQSRREAGFVSAKRDSWPQVKVKTRAPPEIKAYQSLRMMEPEKSNDRNEIRHRTSAVIPPKAKTMDLDDLDFVLSTTSALPKKKLDGHNVALHKAGHSIPPTSTVRPVPLPKGRSISYTSIILPPVPKPVKPVPPAVAMGTAVPTNGTLKGVSAPRAHSNTLDHVGYSTKPANPKEPAPASIKPSAPEPTHGLAALPHLAADVTLRYWRIRKIRVESIQNFQKARLSVDGVKLDSDGEPIMSEEGFPLQWHSSAIGNRIGSHVLETSSGKVYRLVGPMEVEQARREGFSRAFCEKFRHGFPHNWKALSKDEFSRPTPRSSPEFRENGTGPKYAPKPAAKTQRVVLEVEIRKEPPLQPAAPQQPAAIKPAEPMQAHDGVWDDILKTAAEAVPDLMDMGDDDLADARPTLPTQPPETARHVSEASAVPAAGDAQIERLNNEHVPAPDKGNEDAQGWSVVHPVPPRTSPVVGQQPELMVKLPSVDSAKEVIQPSDEEEEDEKPECRGSEEIEAPVQRNEVSHQTNGEDTKREVETRPASDEAGNVADVREEQEAAPAALEKPDDLIVTETTDRAEVKSRGNRKASKPTHVPTPPRPVPVTLPAKRANEGGERQPRKIRYLKQLLSGPFGTPRDLSGLPRVSTSRERRSSRPAGNWWAVDRENTPDPSLREKRSMSTTNARRATMPPEDRLGSHLRDDRRQADLSKRRLGKSLGGPTSRTSNHAFVANANAALNSDPRTPTRPTMRRSPPRSVSQPPSSCRRANSHEARLDYMFSE